MKTRRGFTLIEMLTVIVILGILATLTLKTMTYVNQKTGKSRAVGAIERIKHALTEYYSVYGCYPPTSGMAWESGLYAPAYDPAGGMQFSDGLAKYLYDDAQKVRWGKYVDELRSEWLRGHFGGDSSGNKVGWTNKVVSIHDPWDRDFIYTTKEPYQSFLLYSVGPDGAAGTADDVGNKWVE